MKTAVMKCVHLTLTVLQPKVEEKGKTETLEGWHHFCKLCGTQLYIWCPSSPEEINPMASSVDTILPTPPERHHIFLKDKAPWVKYPPRSRFHQARCLKPFPTFFQF